MIGTRLRELLAELAELRQRAKVAREKTQMLRRDHRFIVETARSHSQRLVAVSRQLARPNFCEDGDGYGRIRRYSTAKRDKEHYEIARRFGVDRPFTLSEFKLLYRKEYPKRISEPIPSGYCVNLNQKVAERCPKFLRWLGRGRYQFIGRSTCLPTSNAVPQAELAS